LVIMMSVCLSFCLSVCLYISICLSVCVTDHDVCLSLSVCLLVCFPVYVSLFLCSPMFICIFIPDGRALLRGYVCSPVCLCAYMSPSLCVYLSFLSVCMSVCLSFLPPAQVFSVPIEECYYRLVVPVSVCLSVCLLVCVSVSVSVCRYSQCLLKNVVTKRWQRHSLVIAGENKQRPVLTSWLRLVLSRLSLWLFHGTTSPPALTKKFVELWSTNHKV